MNRARRYTYKIRALSSSLIALLLLLTLNLNGYFDGAQQDNQGNSKSAVQAQYASLPLAFEPNQGQVVSSAQFLVHHGQATTYFDGANTTTTVGDSRVTMSLDGANTTNFTGTDQLESKTNYFIGNDQAKWHSDVPNYKNLLAKNVYPGIDLKYYGTNSQLEHDFIVNPGADPKDIVFHFDGQNSLSIDADGNLILKTGESDLRLNAPTTYQANSNSKHTIPSQFKLNEHTITIALNADYDHSLPLIIDPTLIFSTYLGGSSTDSSGSIATDASGNTYVSGATLSTNFPTASPYQASNAGGQDVVISKINPSGSALVYSTYLGGSGTDASNAIAVDYSGNAYIAGITSSSNFPTASPFQSTNAGTNDAFLTKLNATGSALTYSTYLGGSSSDQIRAITVDTSSNDAIVVGDTGSTNFPTATPIQASNAGGTADLFITKFTSSGTGLVYSTYLGGSSTDTGTGPHVGIDATGNVYAMGKTLSTNFPTASPYQASNAGGQDLTISKINASGTALVYSTYLGGSGTDGGGGDIAVDSSGSAYVVADTASTNFPTVSPYQAANAGGVDGFITKFNPAGSALTFSTYIGGSGTDTPDGIVIDSSNNSFIVGSTASTNFPTSNPLQAANGGGTSDAFITKLDSAGASLTYSSYLGGSGNENGRGITLGLNGDAYIDGITASTNFPTANAFQAANGGGTDIFVAQLTEHTVDVSGTVVGTVAPILTFTVSSTTCNLGTLSTTQAKSCTHTMTAGTNATNGYVISYIPTATLTSGANTISAMTSQTGSSLGSEQYGLNLKANTAAGSFTAADFGADPSGGVGVAFGNYNNANQFKFTTAGDNIAQSTTSSADTTYTVSYIANINSLTEAGLYAATMTYNIVASY